MRFAFLILIIGLSACASPPLSQPQQINPNYQAVLSVARSSIQKFIGKPIWVYSFGLTLCDAPTCHTDADSNAAQFDPLGQKYVGPLYVKDVLLTGSFVENDDLYLVVNTANGSTKYWYQGNGFAYSNADVTSSLLSSALATVLFEDPKVTAAHAKAACKKRGGVSIGMTEAKVLASCWGKPQDKNITDTVSGRSEQWVYGDGNYLYFEDGILTSMQTSR